MQSLLIVISIALAAGFLEAAPDNMKAFPPAAEGMVRHVLQLPEKEDEEAFKVELVVGKTIKVDRANRHFFAGRIQAENIEGWGFTRYVVDEIGPMAGTLIGVDPDVPKVERFVRIGGDPYLIRYNSRLPVVIYVPEGTEVRYRIWSADPELKVMDEG